MDWRRLTHLIPDRLYIQMMYYYHFHRLANLRNPKTFNEKLQWLKLNDRRPEYITMVDKIAVKDYVAERIGKEFIIPTLGVWDKPDDIDFDTLPNQFVLKWNHDSGSIVICRDKSKLDKEKAIAKLRHGEKVNGYWYGREWPYKGVKPRILAEKYIEPESNPAGDLADYKIFCFDGEPRYIQVIQDRNTNETIDFFDIEWNHQEFVGLNPAAVMPERPQNLGEMLSVARRLSENIPFSRIDLYEVGSHRYFGEVTFYPASGFGMFHPDQYNYIIGEMLKLPGINGGGYNVQIINNVKQVSLADYNLIDYKFMCFGGKVECCFTCTGRSSERGLHVTFYDNDWNIMPFERSHPRELVRVSRPLTYNKMVAAAEALSKDLPFARVDFYEVDGNPYFGEITLYPGSGMEAFQPKEWDRVFGDKIAL